eukprot:SAG22_NODE_19684_length_272_cov_1.167630_1_plen_52_part_10
MVLPFCIILGAGASCLPEAGRHPPIALVIGKGQTPSGAAHAAARLAACAIHV